MIFNSLCVVFSPGGAKKRHTIKIKYHVPREAAWSSAQQYGRVSRAQLTARNHNARQTSRSAPIAPTPTPLPSATPTPDPANDPVFVGAGDIAACGADGTEATARLLDQ